MKIKIFRIIIFLVLGTFFLSPSLEVEAGNQEGQLISSEKLTAPSYGTTTRVSVSSDGSQGNSASGTNSISADGRFVAFDSQASNLVSGDTNGFQDVFVHDRLTGITERVSLADDESQGNNHSGAYYPPSISADGKFVAFTSYASNLVSGDTNNFCDIDGDKEFSDNCPDIFVRNRQSGTIERVSVSSDGTQGNYWSDRPSISADGRYVVFKSYASNLVSGDTNNVCDTDGDKDFNDNCPDIFVHDRETGITKRVSIASDKTQGDGWSDYAFISADGQFVAFGSASSTLVSGDTNASWDVFLHDLQNGTTVRVSVDSDGNQGNSGSDFPAISADGNFIAFRSEASNLVNNDTNDKWDVFVHDMSMGETERISVASNGSQGNSWSDIPAISADGRFVAFDSDASNLVSGDTNGTWDIFVHDRQTDSTQRVSVSSDGNQGDGMSIDQPCISADGRFVSFGSAATNLVNGDTNGFWDVFVHDREGRNYLIYLPISLKTP
jgi:Tol biopolymer transport system component